MNWIKPVSVLKNVYAAIFAAYPHSVAVVEDVVLDLLATTGLFSNLPGCGLSRNLMTTGRAAQQTISEYISDSGEDSHCASVAKNSAAPANPATGPASSALGSHMMESDALLLHLGRLFICSVLLQLPRSDGDEIEERGLVGVGSMPAGV